MNDTTDSNSNDKNSKDKSKSNKWLFFKKVYQFIAPKFLGASGVLFALAISLFATDGKAWGWFSISLAIIFFLLFILELIRTHIFTYKVKFTISILLILAIFATAIFGITQLLPTKSSPSIQQTLSTQNQIIKNSNSSTINKDSLRTKPKVHKSIPKQPKSEIEPYKENKQPQYQSVPPLPIENITYVVEPVSSSDANFPFGIRVTIQTNIKIERPHLQINCTAPVGKGDFFFPNCGVMTMTRTQWGKNRNGDNAFDFSCETPDFTPQRPIVVTLFSKEQNSIIRVIHIPS